MSAQKPLVRILIADDSIMTQRVLSQKAEQFGFEVVGVASDGRRAIEEWRRLQPDAVLLDLVMPELDGIAVLDTLRGEDPTAKVVILSARQAKKDVLRCRERGASGYVLKPFEPRHVFQTLKRALQVDARNAP